MKSFFDLTVKEIKRETEDSISIKFDIPKDLQAKFKFIPGQYLTVKKIIGGKEIRRAYSICSSKYSSTIKIGVKAVKKGIFSTYATTKLKDGDVLEVSIPEGRFLLEPSYNSKNNYVAIAVGSGITPILSMLKSVLETESEDNFILIYGNKSPKETMFKNEIDQLEAKYKERLFVYYTFSKASLDDTLFGRIDRSTINFILKNKHKDLIFKDFFICGPHDLIDWVRDDLIEKGYLEENIHYELFTTESNNVGAHQKIEGKSLITVILDEEKDSFTMDRKKSILSAVLEKGLDAPFSCQGGICSTCLAKIIEGKAIMDSNSILTDDEVNEGLILTCQAHPITDKITIDYDAV
jgi:ring-1,2-phenylacetyl-CoA epoxidase subunit PaaE